MALLQLSSAAILTADDVGRPVRRRRRADAGGETLAPVQRAMVQPAD